MRCIEQESYEFADPITRFLDCLFLQYDFEGAQQQLALCEQVLDEDYFLTSIREVRRLAPHGSSPVLECLLPSLVPGGGAGFGGKEVLGGANTLCVCGGLGEGGSGRPRDALRSSRAHTALWMHGAMASGISAVLGWDDGCLIQAA